jgi:hypothetical protein
MINLSQEVFPESEVRIRRTTDSADLKDSLLDQRVVNQSSLQHTSMDNQVLVPDSTRTSEGSTLATSTKKTETAKITGVLQQQSLDSQHS